MNPLLPLLLVQMLGLFPYRVRSRLTSSSATRRTGRNDCNRDAPAGLDVMKG